MGALGLIIGVMGIVIGAAAWILWWSRANGVNEVRTTLENNLRQADGRRRKAERKAEELSERSRRLQRELNVARERRSEKATAQAMWNLELTRAERRWREVVVPNDTATTDNASDGVLLTDAVARDVERLREEVGVSIRFTGAIDCDLDPEVALGALRITEEVLAFTTKNSDEVAVTLDETDDRSIAIEVTCDGFDGDIENSELMTGVKAMAQRLGGWGTYKTPGTDVAEVSVRLPVGRASSMENMSLRTSAFEDGQRIPDRFAKLNDNVSPEFTWSGTPRGTSELVITCLDPDAPNGTFVHWLVVGIEPTATGCDEGKPPPGAIEGSNGWSENRWGGPQPPEGDKAHRYYFEIHACASPLDLSEGFSHADLVAALSEVEIASATVMGTYQRP